jgi:hypothetical protein
MTRWQGWSFLRKSFFLDDGVDVVDLFRRTLPKDREALFWLDLYVIPPKATDLPPSSPLSKRPRAD